MYMQHLCHLLEASGGEGRLRVYEACCAWASFSCRCR